MNQQEHFNELKIKLTELKTTFEGGLPVTSSDLTSIASQTLVLSDCVTSGNKIKTNFRELNDHVISSNSGNLEDGTLRVCIADNDTNLTAIKVASEQIASTINMAGFQAVDIATINGTVVQEGAGSVGSGVQRVAIANDDTNLSAINTNVNNIVPLVTAWNSGYVPAVNVNLLGVQFGAGANPIAVSNGNLNTATLRVCIADDDTNLAHINAILSDVWDSTAHALRTV
jgi:hypothetical protein